MVLDWISSCQSLLCIFNSNYTKHYVAKLNKLNISEPYNASGVFFRRTETAMARVTDL